MTKTITYKSTFTKTKFKTADEKNTDTDRHYLHA